MTKDNKHSFRLSYLAGSLDVINYIINTWGYDIPSLMEDVLLLKKEALEKEFKEIIGDRQCNLLN